MSTLRLLAEEKGLSADAIDYIHRRYKLNGPNGKFSRTLKGYEGYFSIYEIFRATGLDIAGRFTFASFLNAAMWGRKTGRLTDSTIKPFLSSFAIFLELAHGQRLKDIGVVSNVRTTATKFTKVLTCVFVA